LRKGGWEGLQFRRFGIGGKRGRTGGRTVDYALLASPRGPRRALQKGKRSDEKKSAPGSGR